MSDPRQDLQSTSASFDRDAEHLAKLEEAKLALDPADPRMAGLSE